MINLQAPINTLGYGVAGFNINKELYELDDSISLYPIGKIDSIYTDETSIQQSLKNSFTPDLFRPTIKIWHQNDLFSRIGKGLYFGFPIFELDTFNSLEIASINHCDAIMVCSNWAKKIVQKHSDIETFVIPLGVDTDVFYPNQNINKKTTIFFNCGKWEKRKGHDILIECFNLAFDRNDDVELWMMCDNPFIGQQNEAWKLLYKNSKLGDKIKFIPRQETHHDVAKIMNMVDCGVFPARAEGWNLELLEMMACGKNVITTNYSAHTEFCTEKNSRLINITDTEVAFDGVFFNGKVGNWAALLDAQVEQLVYNMRDIHKKKQSNSLSLNMYGVETALIYTWKNISMLISEIING